MCGKVGQEGSNARDRERTRDNVKRGRERMMESEGGSDRPCISKEK